MTYFEALFLAPPRFVVAFVVTFVFLDVFLNIRYKPRKKILWSRQNRHLTGFPGETSHLDRKMEVQPTITLSNNESNENGKETGFD